MSTDVSTSCSVVNGFVNAGGIACSLGWRLGGGSEASVQPTIPRNVAEDIAKDFQYLMSYLGSPPVPRPCANSEIAPRVRVGDACFWHGR